MTWVPWPLADFAALALVIVVVLVGHQLRTWWNMNRLRNDLDRRRRLRRDGRDASDPPDNEP